MSDFVSINPATGELVWSGRGADSVDVDAAVQCARDAFAIWSQTSLNERERILRRFAEILKGNQEILAEAISREVGKPNWEALTEVVSMVAKVELSIQAYAARCASFVGGPAVTRFRPHGVIAVLGPFNFPGHLPNGHIVPSLLAGNTVVFKPSEYAPLVAQLTLDLWKQAGLPAGVLNLLQGGKDTGAALASHRGIDGLFFTGSSRVGIWLSEQFAKTPNRILALEMGGNNPLVVWGVGDLDAASLLTIQSAFLSAGQRCTCARRLIVSSGRDGDAVLANLAKRMACIRVGAPTDRPEPFMGPVISNQAAAQILQTQATLVEQGGRAMVEARLMKQGTGLLSPGLMDVTALPHRDDEECFGPLLQVIRVHTFTDAVAEANRTRYGLAAGLLSDDRQLYEQFAAEAHAGIINWNQPLTGASGAAPFGGVGLSGNHRPSGFFASDYCSYPVASIEVPKLESPAKKTIGIEDESRC